jgi:hypothetical protein
MLRSTERIFQNITRFIQLLFSSTAVEKTKICETFALVISFSFLRYQLLFEVLVCFRNIFE